MITVEIERRTLEDLDACEEGLLAFDKLAALQGTPDRIRIVWDALTEIWSRVAWRDPWETYDVDLMWLRHNRLLPVVHLSDVDLRGADLAYADLSGLVLWDADLTGADLSDADLSGAVLTGALLVGASLQNADLDGACLPGADLRGADLTSTLLQHTSLYQANLRGAVLAGAVLDFADLREADLSGADLTGAHVASEAEVPAGWARDAHGGLARAEG